MKTQNVMQIDFLSKSSNEGFARVSVAAFAAQLDPTLVHAYPDTLGKIRIRAKLSQEHVLELYIRDWGKGIADVKKARQPMFTTGGEERSGMGFTIMESFMDTLQVRSAPGKGTTVIMKRRIAVRGDETP